MANQCTPESDLARCFICDCWLPLVTMIKETTLNAKNRPQSYLLCERCYSQWHTIENDDNDRLRNTDT